MTQRGRTPQGPLGPEAQRCNRRFSAGAVVQALIARLAPALLHGLRPRRVPPPPWPVGGRLGLLPVHLPGLAGATTLRRPRAYRRPALEARPATETQVRQPRATPLPKTSALFRKPRRRLKPRFPRQRRRPQPHADGRGGATQRPKPIWQPRRRPKSSSVTPTADLNPEWAKVPPRATTYTPVGTPQRHT